jgi:hypothetical protein
VDWEVECADVASEPPALRDVPTRADGQYVVNLPAGRYSVFLVLPDCEYRPPGGSTADVEPGDYHLLPFFLNRAAW